MKTILITGSTDGIGLATLKNLLPLGHNLIVHGRSEKKVNDTIALLQSMNRKSKLFGCSADLTKRNEIYDLAKYVKETFGELDVLVNNAGVYNVPIVKTVNDLDIRLDVNTVAPYLLTKLLLPIMGKGSRVVNLSSAAQSPVNFSAFQQFTPMSAGDAYAQSKLAILMWGISLGEQHTDKVIVSVNPRSFLGSKMVKEAYGIDGHDVNIGADIIIRASLSDEFENANCKYFDNDRGIFSMPHPFALQKHAREQLVLVLDSIL